MKNIYLFIVILIFTSCVTQKRCLNKFPPDTTTTISVVYRDTVIPVYLPYFDTVYATSTIYDTLVVNQGTVRVRTWVVRDTIYQNLWQVDTTLYLTIDSLIRDTTIKKLDIITIKEKVGLWRFLSFILFGVLLLAIILIFLKIK